ncbi:MAG: aldehyde dehydrogenase family protein, partial [Nitrososphaerales archaeon]
MHQNNVELRLSPLFDGIWRRSEDDLPLFKLYINGEWIESSTKEYIKVDTPINGKVVAYASKASLEDVDRAIASAHNNKQEIRDIPGIDRIEIFKRAADILKSHKKDFINTLTLEVGKTP